jgi:hypothetical protein
MKYVERKFSLRVRKTDGTAKLLVGMSAAGGFYIGKLIKVAKITAQPKALNEPWEAIQV